MKATLALLLAAIAHGEELTGNRAPATAQCPTPDEARATTSVPDGYAVRCFAHEPMVVNPVVMPSATIRHPAAQVVKGILA